MEKLSKIDAIVCRCKSEKELKDLLALSKKADINWSNGCIIDICYDMNRCFDEHKNTFIYFGKNSENILSIRYSIMQKKEYSKNGFQKVYELKCFLLDFKVFEKILYHYCIKTKRNGKVSMSMS